MKKKRPIILIWLLISGCMASQVIWAESSLTGNIGVTTNYVWRGITQSDDRAAVSAGLDYVHSTGWYIGGWTTSLDGSNSDGNYELDIYTGYRFTIGTVEMDVGYIDYRYPVGTFKVDFGEIYLNINYKNYGIGVAHTVRREDSTNKNEDNYYFISAAFELKKDLYLDLLFGEYQFEDPAQDDYGHGIIGLRKNNFSISFHKNRLDGDAGDTRWSGSWTKTFDL